MCLSQDHARHWPCPSRILAFSLAQEALATCFDEGVSNWRCGVFVGGEKDHAAGLGLDSPATQGLIMLISSGTLSWAFSSAASSLQHC